MKVTEYMPKVLNRVYYLGVVICFALVALTIALFCRQLEELLNTKAEYMVYEKEIKAYEEFVQIADGYFEENDYKAAEPYYLEAVNSLPLDSHVYIRLASIYEYYKEYDWAVSALEKYPDGFENEDISEAQRALQAKIEQLEQSIFQMEG